MTPTATAASSKLSPNVTLFPSTTLPAVQRLMYLPFMPLPSVDHTSAIPATTSSAPTRLSVPALSNRPHLNTPAAVTAIQPSVGETQRSDPSGDRGYSGFKKGVLPEMLRPVDAPTEPRTYYAESATSRRDSSHPPDIYQIHSTPTIGSPVPKTASSADSSGVTDVTMTNDSPCRPGLTPDTTPEPDTLSERLRTDRARRRSQNTLAARRSRARKLETVLKLESERDAALSRVSELEEELSRALADNAALRGRLNRLGEHSG